MSAANVEEKSPGSKTSEINRKEVEVLTDVLFLRKNTEKISRIQKARKKKTKAPSAGIHCEAHMVGTIEEGTATAKIGWRIMGMRMKRSDGVTTDYDVHRMPFVREVEGQKICERLPMDKREGILRLCRYESEYDIKMFKHEYCMFKMLAKSYPSSTNRIHYPAVLGQGQLSELRYLNLNDTSAKRHDVIEKPAIPRPYFILESFEPSLETLFKSNRNKSLSVNISVFAAIGCIKALRLLHMKGFAHRNVQPAYFSIRFPCGGLLSRSIETLSGKEPTAIDDMISCIYIMTEFALGQIPWYKETEKQAIINNKKKVEGWPRVEDDRGTVLLNNYSKLFEWLRQQPPLRTIDYEALYEEMLRMPETGQPSTTDQSLFGFSNPLSDAYDHGFTEKKQGKDKRTRTKDKEGGSSRQRQKGDTDRGKVTSSRLSTEREKKTGASGYDKGSKQYAASSQQHSRTGNDRSGKTRKRSSD